jgi:hypothetical protein
MGNDAKDYLEIFRQFPEKRKDYYRDLRDAAWTVMHLLFSRYSSGVPRDDVACFDFDLFYRYSTEITQSVFDRFGCLAMDFLSREGPFERYVEADVESGILRQTAVIDYFIDFATDSPFGDGESYIDSFMKAYRAWTMAQPYSAITLENVMETHRENVASWRSPENTPDGKENADERKALTVIGDAFLDFMTEACYSSIDRQIALCIEKDVFFSLVTDDAPSVLSDFRRSEYSSGMTEREMRLEIDRVRRRLLAFLVVDGAARRLPENAFNKDPDRNFESMFMTCAGVESIESARRLVQVERLPLRFHNWDLRPWPADTLPRLELYYEAQGIRAEPATVDSGRILRLWYSLTEGKVTEDQGTIVYANGAYRDIATGTSGWVKDTI